MSEENVNCVVKEEEKCVLLFYVEDLWSFPASKAPKITPLSLVEENRKLREFMDNLADLDGI